MRDDYLDDGENRQSIAKKIILVLAVIVLLVIAVVFVRNFRADQHSKNLLNDLTEAQASLTVRESIIPIDFAAVQAENSEIYAWISIPNTGIELPILQSRKDDLYYLKRDIYGEYSRLGSIFTQSHNKLDFSDPVTVIYGHNYLTGGMFTNLHYFEDETFFKDNEVMYIYTPTRKLTYSIVSAYKYDNRHILNSFDFSDITVLTEYQQYVLNPRSMLKNVRENAKINPDDKLVVLSTCLTYGYSGRYLVNGVLISDEFDG